MSFDREIPSIICSKITFYVHEQDSTVLDAIGTSSYGNDLKTLTLGYTNMFEVQLESYKELDPDGARCSTYTGYSYSQVRPKNNSLLIS